MNWLNILRLAQVQTYHILIKQSLNLYLTISAWRNEINYSVNSFFLLKIWFLINKSFENILIDCYKKLIVILRNLLLLFLLFRFDFLSFKRQKLDLLRKLLKFENSHCQWPLKHVSCFFLISLTERNKYPIGFSRLGNFLSRINCMFSIY